MQVVLFWLKDLAMKHSHPPLSGYLLNRSNDYEIVPVFIGKHSEARAIDLHSILPTTLYLPPSLSPFVYEWPIAGCELYIVDTGRSFQSFIKHCALCFYSYGAVKITYLSKNCVIELSKG